MALLNEVVKATSRYTSSYKATEDGSITTIDITQKEYTDLAVRGATEPPRRGLPVGKTWQWVRSEEIAQFNTVDKSLAVRDFYIELNGDFIVNVQTGFVVPLKAKHFTITKTLGTYTIAPSPFGFTLIANDLVVLNASAVRLNWNLL